MQTNLKILRDATEYLQDDTRSEPDKLRKTLITALNAIEAELEDIKQDIRDITVSS